MGSLDVDSEGPASAYYNEAERRSRWRRVAIGLFVAFSGIAISFLLSWYLGEREQELSQAQFKIDANERIEALQQTVIARLAAVSTTAAFIRGSDVKDRKGFSAFVNQILQRQPTIDMLAWAPHVPAARRHSHEQAVRKEGFSKYVIGEHDPQGKPMVAGDRDEYYPILLVEPLRKHQLTLGWDLGSIAAFRATAREAVAGHPTVVKSLMWNGEETDAVCCA